MATALSKEKIIKKFRALEEVLDYTPSGIEMDRLAGIPNYYFQKYWGGYKAFLKAMQREVADRGRLLPEVTCATSPHPTGGKREKMRAAREKEQRVVQAIILGQDIETIAAETGGDKTSIRRIGAANSRIIDIFRRRIAGATLQEIGDVYGISRERVRQLLARPRYATLVQGIENHKESTRRQLREDTLVEYFKLRRAMLRKPRVEEFADPEKIYAAWGKNTANDLVYFAEDSWGEYPRRHTREEMRWLLYVAFAETGKYPNSAVMTGYGLFSQEIENEFGTFGNFLLDAGLLPNRGGSVEEAKRNIILAYKQVKEMLGGTTPTLAQMDELGRYDANTLQLYWDGYANFLADAEAAPFDWPVNVPTPILGTVGREKPWDTEILSPKFQYVLEYFRLRNVLIRKPVVEEFSAPEKLLAAWGTYPELIRRAEGLDAEEALKPHMRWEIKLLYAKAYTATRGNVSPAELELHTGVTLDEIKDFWGTWGAFYAAHRPTKELFTTEEEFRAAVIAEYRAVKARLGKEPTLDELVQHGKYPRGAYLTIWQKYQNFLWVVEGAAANGIPTEGKTIRKELTHAYVQLVKENKRLPTYQEMAAAGLSTANYTVCFGGIEEFWRHAVEQKLLRKDMLERKTISRRGNATQYTTQELVTHFLAVQKKLGRQPSFEDMVKESPPSVGVYVNRYGSWTAFLATLGMTPLSGGRRKENQYTKEALVAHFQDVWSRLGRQPTRKEMAQYGPPGPKTYRIHFGSWGAFLVEMGLEAYRRQPSHAYSDQELADHFYAVWKKLGHQPGYEEMRGFSPPGMHVYLRRYGKWSKFLETLGLRGKKRGGGEKTRKYSDEDLVRHFYAVWKQIGRQPSLSDMNQAGSPLPSSYVLRYGSWGKFLDSQGLANPGMGPYRKIYSEEDLIEHFYDVWEKLGYQPSMNDMRGFSPPASVTYTRKFGSWGKFLAQLGLASYKSRYRDKSPSRPPGR